MMPQTPGAGGFMRVLDGRSQQDREPRARTAAARSADTTDGAALVGCAHRRVRRGRPDDVELRADTQRTPGGPAPTPRRSVTCYFVPPS
jgi:hypothetical protein